MGTQASQNISRETSNPKVDPVDQQLLKLLSDDPDDDIMLFLRSLAPQMRIVPADRQFSLRMEMMQLMIRYAQRPAVSSAPMVSLQHSMTPPLHSMTPPPPQHSMTPPPPSMTPPPTQPSISTLPPQTQPV